MYGTSSTVFKYASNLLRLWYGARNTSTVYESVIDAVWSAVSRIVLSPIGIENDASDMITNSSDLEERLKIHLKFVNSLKNPIDIRSKKQAKVTTYNFDSIFSNALTNVLYLSFIDVFRLDSLSMRNVTIMIDWKIRP